MGSSGSRWVSGSFGGGMFQGTTVLSLDAKGRLAIPSRHRDELTAASNGTLVMTAHRHGCALIYPVATWEPIRDRLSKIPSLDKRAASIRRVMLGHAEELSLDAAGRVLVPQGLREHADLKDKVWMVGQGLNFELWSDARWKQQMDEAAEMGPDDVPESLEDLVL